MTFAPRKHLPVLPAEIGLAAIVGTVCGLLDALALQLNFLGARGGIDWVPPRMWVAIPAAWTLLCLIPAVVAIGLRHRPRLHRWFPPMLALVGPGALILARLVAAIRFPFPDLHYTIPGALWILAIVPLMWIAHRYGDRVPPRASAAGGGMLLVLAAGIVAAAVFSMIESRSAVAAAADGRPNLLLIVLDTVRGDSSGLTPGESDRAPAIAAFASRGAIFEEAWAPTGWTLFSHLAMITGKTVGELKIDYDHQRYDETRPTLAEALGARGWSTGAVVANGFLNPGTGFERGYDRLIYSRTQLDLCRSSFGFVIRNFGPYVGIDACVWNGDQITDRALSLVSEMEAPWFLTLNYMDAHIPYHVGPDCDGRAATEFRPLRDFPPLEKVNRLGIPFEGALRERYVTRYEAAIRCLDRSVGRLLEGLAARRGLDDTYVVITSDHGEQFGEHDLTLHGNSVYRQALHVPLAIVGPGIEPSRVREPVDITSLYWTLLALSGESRLRASEVLVDPGARERERTIFGIHDPPRRLFRLPSRIGLPVWSAVEGTRHYIARADGSEELYDFTTDPQERNNLLEEGTSMQEAAAALRRALETRVVMTGPTQEQRDRYYSLGYIQ